MSLVAVGRKNPLLPWWVCPPDRELALRGKINTGYSTIASRIQKNRYAPIIRSTNVGKLSDAEVEIIKRVIKRAEEMERAEEIRIGCLMLKHKQMREASCGDGAATCILCGCELGATQEEGQVPMVYCHTCAKAACHRCSCETRLRSGERVTMCRLCFEEQELWCKSGSWMRNSAPNISLPDSALEQLQEEVNMASANFSRSLDLMPSLWANQDTEESVSEDDDDSKQGFSYNITFNDRDTESVNSDVIATSWRKINSRHTSRSRSNSRSSSASLPGDASNSPAEFTPVMSRKPIGTVEQLSIDEPTIDDVPLVSMRSKSSSLKRSGAMTPTQRNSFRRMREKMKEKQNSLSDDRRSRSGSPAAHSDLENSLKFSDRGRRWTADVSATSGSYDVELASRGRSSSSHSSGRAGDSESESELAASLQARSNGRGSLPIIVVDQPLSARLAARATRHSGSFDLDDRTESDELPKVDHKWKRKNASRIGRRQQQESEPVLTKFEAKVTDLTSTSLDTAERDPPVFKDTEKSEESSIPPPQPKPSEDDQEENQIGAFPRRSIQADDNKIKRMREKARLSARRARQEGMSRAVREQEGEEFEQAPSPSPVLGGETVENNQSQVEPIAKEPESEVQQQAVEKEPESEIQQTEPEREIQQPEPEHEIQQAVDPPTEQPTKSPLPLETVTPAEIKVSEEPVKTTVEEAVVDAQTEEPVREKTAEVTAEAPVEEPADVPPPLPPRDTEDKNEVEPVITQEPPQPFPEETLQSKEEEVKTLPESETAQEDKTEAQVEEKPQEVRNEPASADTAVSTVVSDQSEVTGEQEMPAKPSFHRRNVTRSRVKRPPPRLSASDSSPSHKTESEEAPSTKSSEETKKDEEVQMVSERSTIQADDAELQRKREKARLAARRMRGGKYYAPSSQEDSPSVPAAREEAQSPVRADSESRSESISSSHRLLSIQGSKPRPTPRVLRKPDDDVKPVAESSQMDDEELPKPGRFRRRNATRSERRGSSRRQFPPSPDHAEGDSSQAVTIENQGDEKLV